MSTRIKAEIKKSTPKAFFLSGNGSNHWVPRSVLTDVERTQAGLTATVKPWYVRRNPEIKIMAQD